MLSRLKHLEFNAPALRGEMRGLLFPDGQWTTVRWGPLRGIKIKNNADVNLHLLIGAWELRSFTLLGQVFRVVGAAKWQGAVADVGANLGAYSYWLDRRLPAIRAIYAFEPSPETAARLRQHLAASAVGRVQVVEAACIESDHSVEFFLAHHHHSSSVVSTFAYAEVPHEQRTFLTVQGVALDNFLTNEPHPIHFIKMDIEGGAVFALEGMKQTIARHRPLILIESHTPKEDHAISEMLLANNYDAFRLTTERWVRQKNDDYTNPEGVWGTMLCLPHEQQALIETVLK